MPSNGNQDTTQKYTYQKEIMPEINYTKELPEGNLPNNLKLITKYQWRKPILMAKYKDGTYHKGDFYVESNIYLNLIACEDNIAIPNIIQSYVLNWCHMYLLHPGMDITEATICQHL